MGTVGELQQRADDKLRAQELAAALALYVRVLELQPLNLDARLRIADSLLALGEVQRAAVVYTKLAQHAAHAGYPLRALVAIKILEALEPQLGELVRSVGALYGRDSQRLGQSMRRSLPERDEAVPESLEPAELAPATPPERAEQLACDYRHRDIFDPDRLMPIPVLSLLSRDEFAAVISAIGLRRVHPATLIIEQGAKDRSFFVLARGKVEVVRSDAAANEHRLSTLHEGAIFGEMALLSNAERSASVRALEDCDLLEFDREALSRAAESAGNLQAALTEFARERVLHNALNTARVFRPLDGKQRKDLMRRFVVVEVRAEAALIRQGDPGQGLYVLLHGQVAVTREEDGRRVELATLEAGDTFGEMSLLGDEPASATVTASKPSNLLFLSREYFERLLQAVPEVRAELEALHEERQLDTSIAIAALEDEPQALDRAREDEPEDALDVEVLI